MRELRVAVEGEMPSDGVEINRQLSLKGGNSRSQFHVEYSLTIRLVLLPTKLIHIDSDESECGGEAERSRA
jgi:hypothetical protein